MFFPPGLLSIEIRLGTPVYVFVLGEAVQWNGCLCISGLYSQYAVASLPGLWQCKMFPHIAKYCWEGATAKPHFLAECDSVCQSHIVFEISLWVWCLQANNLRHVMYVMESIHGLLCLCFCLNFNTRRRWRAGRSQVQDNHLSTVVSTWFFQLLLGHDVLSLWNLLNWPCLLSVILCYSAPFTATSHQVTVKQECDPREAGWQCKLYTVT